MSKKTVALILSGLAFLALPTVASANPRTVPMNAAKAAIKRKASSLGRSVAKQTGDAFVSARLYACKRRAGGVSCGVRVDFAGIYCTLNASSTYSSGSLYTRFTSQAACKKDSKPKPPVRQSAPPAPSGPRVVPIGAGEAAIQAKAKAMGQDGGADDLSVDGCEYADRTHSELDCDVTWDIGAGAEQCSDVLWAYYPNGSSSIAAGDDPANLTCTDGSGGYVGA